MKKTFISNIGFQDAIMKCKLAGFAPVGQVFNKQGQYLVFGKKVF